MPIKPEQDEKKRNKHQARKSNSFKKYNKRELFQ